MNRYKKLIGNSAIFAVGNLGSKLMQFILIPVYSYTLTTSQFGKADFITTIIGLVSPLIYLDMVDGVFRFTLDESEDKKRVFSTGLLFTTIISIIAFMTGLAVAPFISKYPILDATLLLVVTTFFGLISNYVRAIGRVGTFAVAGIINTFIMGASNIIFLVIFHGGISSYLEAMVLGQIAAIIYFLISTPIIKQIRLKWFDIKLFREMCVYSIPLIPNTFAWWLNSASDRFFILMIIGASANGIYAMVNRFPTMVTTLTSIFFQSWQMTAIEEYDSKDSREFISNVFEYIISLIFLFSLGMLSVLKPMIRILLATDYYGGWKLIPIMLLVSIYTITSGFLGVLYTASKNTVGVFYSTLLGAIINVLLTVSLIRWIGVYGAAIANAISFFSVFLYRYIHIKKLGKIQMNIAKFVLLHILLAIAAAINYEVNNSAFVFIVVLICIIIQISIDRRIKVIILDIVKVISGVRV